VGGGWRQRRQNNGGNNDGDNNNGPTAAATAGVAVVATTTLTVADKDDGCLRKWKGKGAGPIWLLSICVCVDLSSGKRGCFQY
jgi:hypothetical protein